MKKSAGLAALATATLASCTGVFGLLRLNNAPSYDSYNSNANIKKMIGVYLNAADLRGNTQNIFEIVSGKKIKYRAKWLSKFFKSHFVDWSSLSEVDYEGTLKTGSLNQPKLIADYWGSPFNYVAIDKYLKSPGWVTGNAIISRFPMKLIKRHIFGENKPFGRLKHTYKDFIHANLKVGRRKLENITNHFNDGFLSVRMQEAKELAEYVYNFYKEDPVSYIVAPGDYNSKHNSRPIRKILESGILAPPTKNFGIKTYRLHNPYSDIDHIFATRNMKFNYYETFDFPWSDHKGLICELEFKD